MARKLNALKARKNFGQLLEEVFYRGDQYIIERAGRPMAAVVPLWQLEAWQRRRERFFQDVEDLWMRSAREKLQVTDEEVQDAVLAARKQDVPRKTGAARRKA